MNNKKGQKAKLREKYFSETGIFPLDNLNRYNYWLEDEIVNNINYTRCSTQLRDKKVKDIVNLAKSELSNYNKQKVLKVETEQDKWHKKLLNKIVELNS
jgi:hypothetical protein